MAVSEAYELTIGLEVHIQLATQTKLFSSEPNRYGQDPNTNVGVITAAHPGVMPKLNKQAVIYAIRMGLACQSEINRHCIFDRKNYFYPDLPKGFQTTQDRTPICIGGKVFVSPKGEEEKSILLNRIHLEEDAGKSIHKSGDDSSFIDLNRAGVPLIELVTEPCMDTPEQAMALLAEIRQIVRYIEVSDGNMEQGSMRCDANVSIKKKGDTKLGAKVEVKNMNSMRNVGRAIRHEYERQSQQLSAGESIVSETRLFDADTGKTSSMRTKEELNDYRYFPEPDLPPFQVSDEWLNEIADQMPHTPAQVKQKFTETYGLSPYDADVLTGDKSLALFFEEGAAFTNEYKRLANWLMGPIKSLMNDQANDRIPISAKPLGEMINLISEEKLSQGVAAKKVFPFLVENPNLGISKAMEQLGLDQSDQAGDINAMIASILEKHPAKVKAYQGGKKNLIGMFMGELMKESKGGVDPKKANELLRDALET